MKSSQYLCTYHKKASEEYTGKINLPSILLLTVRVVCTESLKINGYLIGLVVETESHVGQVFCQLLLQKGLISLIQTFFAKLKLHKRDKILSDIFSSILISKQNLHM